MIEAYIYSDICDLHVIYSPDADTDGVFEAFCIETQETIRINGWMVTEIEPIQ